MIGGLLKSASSAALFAALGLFAMSGGVSPASAADLGGDCCADLEERVAELEATTARKGNRRVSLEISGAVHTQLMVWDDGTDSDVYVTDYTAGTGFNLTGSAAINPNLTAGFLINIGLNRGSRSLQVNQFDDDADDVFGAGQVGDQTFVITRSGWYLDHKQLGRLTLGRVNTASHGITGINLGGTGVIATPDVSYWNGGFFLRNELGVAGATWTTALGGGTVAGAGSTRGNIVHYTSPTVGGFSVQAAWGEDDIWDAALRYAGEFSGFRLAAGIGYIDNFNSNTGGEFIKDDVTDLADLSSLKVGASLMHVASGLYVTTAYVNEEENDDNTTLWYLQGGITKNWTGLGNTSIYAEYTNVDLASGNESEVWGLGVVQTIDAASMELYVAYRNYSTDILLCGATCAETDDFNILMAGSRIRF